MSNDRKHLWQMDLDTAQVRCVICQRTRTTENRDAACTEPHPGIVYDGKVWRSTPGPGNQSTEGGTRE